MFSGYYTGDTGSPAGTGPRGGVRIFDISNPSSPRLVQDFACDANQNDPIVWDRNGNGVADLMLVAVDRTMANPSCGAPRSAHEDRNGWEGVRIFTMSDDPANPFQAITPVKMQYTDCGAHTITAWTGFADDATNPRLIVYVLRIRCVRDRPAVRPTSTTSPIRTTRTRSSTIRCTARSRSCPCR